ncbi:DUF4105 domain-containing protein [uncultured Polaribacter sp.]|uniref:lipoprotein N-acyltransferase Lnb domain-containing protein n=1 Tax=uncultured Polaribacter sp. TaxID=174711 RepID=UPI002625628F|nr:DUF4105 domain-containing protein [uncultured Polaribacter sp.]
MQKKYFSLLLLLSVYTHFKAQKQLSEFAEVSIVTAGPGEQLYEAFGHSAIRIKDSILNFDLIYNYGMFDFNQPNFYTNFAKGNMIYSLARYDFKYFFASYKRDQRWLKQQILNLTQKEKQAYYNFLENNALPKNRNYNYDPYFDNCATILRDITKNILGNKIIFNDNNPKKELSFRQLTNNEIHWNSWGTFGLNLIAGTKLDQIASFEEYMYLPDYLYSFFKNASIFIKNQPEKLVIKEVNLLNFEEKKTAISIFNPLLIFSILAFWGVFVTYKDFKNNKRTKSLDFILFFITGLIGSILFFLWFFSSHSTAPNNFNILWAFPLNVIVAFLLLKKSPSKWVQKYMWLLMIFLMMIPILWIINFQVFPVIIIPLLILLLIRYFYLANRLLTSKK